MNRAQMFRADLDSPEQLIAFFAAAAVTTALLTVWTVITRATRTLANLTRGHR